VLLCAVAYIRTGKRATNAIGICVEEQPAYSVCIYACTRLRASAGASRVPGIQLQQPRRQTYRQTPWHASTPIHREPKKCLKTKSAMSQKCADIFVLNFAHLFTRQLYKSVLLCAVFS